MLKRLSYAFVLFVMWPPAVLAQGAPPASAANVRLAYFSPQRAFYDSADGKAAQAKLSSIQAEASKQIEAQNAKLKALQNSLAQSSLLLSEAARRAREQEIEKFQIDLQRFVEDAQAEFLGVQRQLESAFLAKLRPALESVAQSRGLLLVLNEDAGVIAWSDPALDITSEVVTRVNQP
jgi:Skp family chaperone for outer membrane proteins